MAKGCSPPSAIQFIETVQDLGYIVVKLHKLGGLFYIHAAPTQHLGQHPTNTGMIGTRVP